eukprot:sb/3477698/
MFTQSVKKIEVKVAVIQLIESRRKSQNLAFSFSQLPCDLVLQFDFYGAHSKDNCEAKNVCTMNVCRLAGDSQLDGSAKSRRCPCHGRQSNYSQPKISIRTYPSKTY